MLHAVLLATTALLLPQLIARGVCAQGASGGSDTASVELRSPRCGDFCSYEHIRSFVGPLDTTANLRAALDALSYKREIVLAHHAQLDQAYQVLHRWQRFGYGHIMLVFPDPGICQRLSSTFPKLGCGWYEDPAVAGWVMKQGNGCKGCTDKWLTHYTGARVVRLGYNVLVADADTMPLYDFYGSMRTPPYDAVSLYNQREGNFNVNGGFYYVQNAAPGGPVAYLLYDNILKNVRWYEDVSLLRQGIGLAPTDASTGIRDGFLCNDQFSLSDAVHSAITGRPQVFECVFWHHPNRTAWERLHLATYATTGPQGASGFGPYNTTRVPVPPPLRAGSGGAAEGELVGAELRIPHARGAWPPERGGYPFPRQLGPMAAAVAALFAEMGPPFPDPADPASAPAADAVPPERWAYFPPWLANSHHFGPSNRGEDGWYNDHLTGRPAAAVSHLHAGLTSGDFTKQVHFAVEVPGGWDYGVAGAVEGREGGAAPYLGTSAHGHVPQLVALAPGVVTATMDGPTFAGVVQGLMRLALSLNRAVVWPWAPCEAPFLRREGATYDPAASGHKIPWADYINTSAAIPYGPGTKSLQAGLSCLVSAMDKVSCLRGGTRPGAPHSAPRGLLPHEFDHWLAGAKRRAAEAAAAGGAAEAAIPAAPLDPGPSNTVQDLLAARGGSTGAVGGALELGAADVVVLGAEPVSRVPVLWLSGAVRVAALPSPEHDRLYDKVAALCCVLQAPPSRQCVDRSPGEQMVPS